MNFGVHLKDNQQLKYLNKGRAHTNATFKAIPTGVIGRLAKLTSRNEDTKNKKMNKLYPQHAKALKQADLEPESWPTLNEALKDANKRKDSKKDKEKKKS